MTLVLAAYLIGSLSFGVILGYLRTGEDIRAKDLPGGSGAFRRLGPGWGVAVALLDAAKGALVGGIALGHPELAPFLAAAVVAGHCWPVFFGFRGGGGIAPTVGFFLVWTPREVLLAVAFALSVAAIYYLVYWRQRRRGIYPIPLGAVPGVFFLLYLLKEDATALASALGAGLAMGLRALELLLRGR